MLTSIVIEEYKVDVINTKLGPEEITRDIPNVREEILASLDKHGIAICGSRVKGGDILVGKVAPKGEKELTAEERLLKILTKKPIQSSQEEIINNPRSRSAKLRAVIKIWQKFLI